MNLLVNNKTVELDNAAVIQDVLNHLGITSLNGIAVAVNNKVVANQELSDHPLKDNDSLLIIEATQGG